MKVSVCPQLKILTKTASHGLILQNLCILDPMTCHRFTLKGKFFVSQEKAQGKAKNSVVTNLNVSADDINLTPLKFEAQYRQGLSNFQDVKYLGQ